MLALKVGPLWMVSSWDQKKPHLRAVSASQVQRLHFQDCLVLGDISSPRSRVWLGFFPSPRSWSQGMELSAWCLFFFKVSLKVLYLQKKCELLTGQKLGARSAEGVYKPNGWFSTTPAAIVQLVECL